MKAILAIALLVIAGVSARSTVQQQQGVLAEGPGCPIADPLDVPGPGPLNLTLHPIVEILEGGIRGDIHATGLSTLHYKINVNTLLLTATFEVTVPQVDVTTTYEASGYLDVRPFRQETIPSGNFTGSGNAVISARNVHLKGKASLWIIVIGNKVTVRSLTLETVSFDSVSIDLGTDFTIAGETVNWAELNANLKANFDQDLAAHKAAITEKIRGAANNIVEKYTLAELIELIGGGDGGGEGEPCPTQAPKLQ